VSTRRFDEDFADQAEIIIAGEHGPDISILALSIAGLVVVGGLSLTILIASESGGRGVALIGLAILPVLTWVLTGAVWRLWDRRPILRADAHGLSLHPSYAVRSLPWSAVKSLAIKTPFFARTGGPPQAFVRLRLTKPIRSLANPFGSHEIRLRLHRLRLSHRQAANLLRHLRRLRNATVAGDQ
jgi:hypothetical protein